MIYPIGTKVKSIADINPHDRIPEVEVGKIGEITTVDLSDSTYFVEFENTGWWFTIDLKLNGYEEKGIVLELYNETATSDCEHLFTIESTDDSSFKILVKEGYEVDIENSTITEIKIKKVEPVCVPTYKDLGKIYGYYVGNDSQVNDAQGYSTENNRNIFATQEQANSSLAQSQLTQFMQRLNGSWKPDWKSEEYKWVIDFYKDEPRVTCAVAYRKFLAFETEKNAKLFIETYRELILEAIELL